MYGFVIFCMVFENLKMIFNMLIYFFKINYLNDIDNFFCFSQSYK